jgi:hypothetical protein
VPEDAPDFAKILETLAKHKVEFIVVGGVCAVLLGAPVTTFDLDIVHARDSENLGRLQKALKELGAHYREHLPRYIEPTLSGLETSGHHLLATRFGPLDVLGSVGINDDFLRLENSIEKLILRDHLSVSILQLNALIEVKEKTAREKDVGMLNILKAMRDLSGSRE